MSTKLPGLAWLALVSECLSITHVRHDLAYTFSFVCLVLICWTCSLVLHFQLVLTKCSLSYMGAKVFLSISSLCSHFNIIAHLSSNVLRWAVIVHVFCPYELSITSQLNSSFASFRYLTRTVVSSCIMGVSISFIH